MTRRKSVKLLTSSTPLFLGVTPWLLNSCNGNGFNPDVEDYLHLAPVDENKLPVLEGKRVPFSWVAYGLAPAIPYQFEFNNKVKKVNQDAWLQIAVAIDVREEKRIEARIAGKNTVLGVFDIRYSAVLHTYQILIKSEYVGDILKYGIELELTQGEKPLWIFVETPGFEANENIFRPHLSIESQSKINKVDSYLKKLISLNSLQPFNWMGGCVMDGLYQIHKHRGSEEAFSMLHQYANMFLKVDKLISETARSEPMDNELKSVEGTLPFAIMAQILDKYHPIFDLVVNFWKSQLKANNAVAHNKLAAEENYTAAYPMAVIGVKRQDDSLIELAVKQLTLRKDALVHEGKNYLRYYLDSGKRTFKNWARGMTWYTLGMVRTMEVVEPYADIEPLRDEFKRVVDFVLEYQNQDGLWSCFIDRPEVAVDTSGLGAAIASGVKLGYLDSSYHEFAKKTWNGLQDYLTPDGLLMGVAQSNRNGETFQASDYRIISQMGMV